MRKLLKQLSLLRGVSGDEGEVAAFIQKEIEPYCESCEIDALGNLLAFKKGKKTPSHSILLDAHMDEVGFILTHIEEDGTLKFAVVGGIDSRVLPGKRVLVGQNAIPGLIGTKPVHLMKEEERDTAPSVENLFFDIGATSKEEALGLVSLGDTAVFDSEFLSLGEDFIKGKALDDRAGCALLMELIQSDDLPCDCWFSFTVQEEVGTVGARTAAHRIQPHYAVMVETTTAADIGGVPHDRQVCRLGDGPVLSFMDRGTVYDRDFYRLALKVAQKEDIPVQSKEGVYGGNNSRAVQQAAAGARCLAVSLACRYLHSPSCVLHRQDIKETRRFLRCLLEELAKQ